MYRIRAMKKGRYIQTHFQALPVPRRSNAVVAVGRRRDRARPRAAVGDQGAARAADLRRTLATGLQRLGVRLEVTEAVLNHLSGSRAGVVGIYQRHDWAEEKRAALDAWSATFSPPRKAGCLQERCCHSAERAQARCSRRQYTPLQTAGGNSWRNWRARDRPTGRRWRLRRRFRRWSWRLLIKYLRPASVCVHRVTPI